MLHSLIQSRLTVLLISPQSYQGPFVSKHYYAHELVLAGHKVFFLNPPALKYPEVKIGDVPGHSNLKIIDWYTAPSFIEFHVHPIFRIFQKMAVRRLLSQIDERIDLVWNFDNCGRIPDLKWIPAQKRIFHPVDFFEPKNTSIGADLIISIHEQILNNARQYPPTSRRIVPHGLSGPFATLAKRILADDFQSSTTAIQPQAFYAGNLVAQGIDVEVLEKVIRQFPQVTFHFCGAVPDVEQIQDKRIKGWVAFLKGTKNCVLHGLLDAKELVVIASICDVMLIAYDRRRSQCRQLNSHKILEYLATGKVIVGSYIESLNGRDLSLCLAAQGRNDQIPDLLAQTLEDRERLNSTYLMKARASYAVEHLYSNHLEKILHEFLKCH